MARRNTAVLDQSQSGPSSPSQGPCRLGAWLPLLVAACCTQLCLSVAAQARNQPPPPASRPTIYDPDPKTCQPDNIRRAFARQLAPYADQGEAVLQQLRKVQLQLTEASLQRCVARGLLDEATARSLAAELLGAQGPGTLTRP